MALRGWRGWLLVTGVWGAMFSFMPRIAPNYQLALLSLAFATQLLPLLAVLELPRPVPPARFWIAVWAVTFFVSDVAQFSISQLSGGENLWFFLLANPIEDAALLMALSHWQVKPVLRLTFRTAIPLLAIVTLAIAAANNEFNTFKAASSPFRLLLITTAVAYTLVVRTSQEDDRIWLRDWLWTSLGVILYYAAYVVVDPVSKALLPDQIELLKLVYVVKAVVDVTAYIMVWKGMRCPVEATSSGSFLARS